MIKLEIPLYNLPRHYKKIKGVIFDSLEEVLEGGEHEGQNQVNAFMREFADYCGVTYAIPTGSGYDALFKALVAVNVGPGDEVITVSNNCIATTAAITHAGGSITWVDIDERTMNMDPNKVKEVITDKTKVILPVHMYGVPVEMKPIMELANRHNLFVVEDAALAVGAEYKGMSVGSIGDIGCFSFGARKTLGNHFHGGVAITADPELAEKLRNLFIYTEVQKWTENIGNFEIHQKFWNTIEGYPGELLPVSSAILRKKLARLDNWNQRKKEIHSLYREILTKTSLILPISSPELPGDTKRCFRNYPVRVKERQKVRKKLAEKGVETGVHYSPPLHLQPVYDSVSYPANSLAITEKVAPRIMTLPMYPELTDKEVIYIAKTLKDVLGSV